METALAAAAERAILKIVCFDEADLDWAKEIAAALARAPAVPLGGHARSRARATCATRSAIATAGSASGSPPTPTLARARVLPQLHVIAWKEATGV